MKITSVWRVVFVDWIAESCISESLKSEISFQEIE